jgi:hypothetical protein
LKLASSSKGAEERIEAIRAAGELGTKLKERRVDLCGQYNSCKMTLAEHNAEDERLAALMASLIKFWDERKFLDADGAQQLRDRVANLSVQLDGKPVDGQPENVDQKPTSVRVLGDKLVKIEGAGLTFSAASGAITISASGDGKRDALSAGLSELQAKSGSRYLVQVTGSYTPSTPALIKPGDEITVRLKYRATTSGEVIVALRSLEDPDASESISTLAIAKAGAGEQQATFTAVPSASGFYVGIGIRGDAAIDLDDVELLRAGSVLASALAEVANESQIETTCSLQKTKPISGKASFACQPGAADLITIGRPRGHLFITARSSSADEKSILRTLSLDGGRSIDVTFTETTQVVIGLIGPGSATIQAVEVKKL